MSDAVLVRGAAGENALTENDVYLIAFAFDQLIGPATLRQVCSLRDDLVAAWQQPNVKSRRHEQQVVASWVAAGERILDGVVDVLTASQHLSKLQEAAPGAPDSVVMRWAGVLHDATFHELAESQFQQLTEQAAHAFVEAVCALAPMAATGQMELLDSDTEAQYVQDFALGWPALVKGHWANEVQQAPRWWRTVRAGHGPPPPIWFHDHPLLLHYSLLHYPEFEEWWAQQIPEVRAILDERGWKAAAARDAAAAEAEAARDRQREAQAGALVGRDALGRRWGTTSGASGRPTLGGRIDYNGGWTAPNQYWDRTIPK